MTPMSMCPVHINRYSDVQSELANYKLTSQLYAQLECSDVGSDNLGSRKDKEEPVTIRPMNSVEIYELSASNVVFKNTCTYLT